MKHKQMDLLVRLLFCLSMWVTSVQKPHRGIRNARQFIP
jgi:hypothetical protein